MKMELPIRADSDGTVTPCRCKPGDLVQPGMRPRRDRMMRYPSRVSVVEVGPRDGLQNEAASIATADKIAFVDKLSEAGLARHRGLVICQPQVGSADGRRGRMSLPESRDAREHDTRPWSRISQVSSARTPPACGRSASSRPHRTRSASATSIRTSTRRSIPTARSALARQSSDIRVRGYVSTAFGCPFEGEVAPARVAAVAEALHEHGNVRSGGQRHDRHRPSRPGARRRRSRRRACAASCGCAAFSRHPGHRAGERSYRARAGDCHVRCVRGRPWRLSVRTGRDGQSGDGGSPSTC